MTKLCYGKFMQFVKIYYWQLKYHVKLCQLWYIALSTAKGEQAKKFRFCDIHIVLLVVKLIRVSTISQSQI